MESTSLWPSFEEIPDIITPQSILIEQATFLEKGSHGLLKCEITSGTTMDKTKLKHVFRIIAPFLGNYSFILLKLAHSANFIYPAEVESVITSESFNITSDKQLIEVLRTIFNNQQTIQVLQNIMAQSKALSKQDSDY